MTSLQINLVPLPHRPLRLNQHLGYCYLEGWRKHLTAGTAKKDEENLKQNNYPDSHSVQCFIFFSLHLFFSSKTTI